MSQSSPLKSLTIILSTFLIVILGTLVISFYARGYQINIKNGLNLKATGLLSVTSKPKAASVYINDRLTTATDDTLNLPPGSYQVKIVKDGYLPWEKNITLKKEIVFQTDAQLFRAVPDLKPITLTGAINPTLSPDGTKIIYAVASASASKNNGLYIIELTGNPLNINKNLPQQIAANFPHLDWSDFSFIFSPNSREIIASSKTANASYLLNLSGPINQNNLYDITFNLPSIQKDWDAQTSQLIASKLDRLPVELRSLVATSSAIDILFNTSEDKVLYLAKTDSQIIPNLISPPPAQSTQLQTRDIKKDHYYIYDLKDDTNFLIGQSSTVQNPFWLPNSDNIIYTEDQKIKAVEYDGTNNLTLFVENFDSQVVFPWNDGSRIITLTSIYPNAPQNLYSISIR